MVVDKIDKVKKFSYKSVDSVRFITSEDRDITFDKIKTGNKYYLGMTENGKTVKKHLKKSETDFKDWVKIALSML